MQNDAPHHIELSNFWPYQVVVLADQIARYTVSIAKAEAGLNLSQWRALAAIAEAPGRSSAEVTAITPMDKTIVSRAVSTLIEGGFVKKSTDITDKRRARLLPTAKGKRVYTKIAGQLNATLVAKFKTDTPPKEFVKILESYSQTMKAISPQKD